MFAEKISQLGFPEPKLVESLRSIAHLFGTNESRCGIYLLVFTQNQAYIGQAIDAVRRFAQHRLNYDDIVWYSFVPVESTRLDQAEIQLIRSAENLGLILLNTVHATNVIGDTDLDFVLPVDQQGAWSIDPECFNRQVQLSPIKVSESQRARFSKRYRKFSSHPFSKPAVDLLRTYLCRCVPSPNATEYSFWAVSCLPATNRNTWPRLFSVNMALMETFVVGYFLEHPKTMWGFLNVASDVLLKEVGNFDELLKIFPSVELVQRNYRDAGQYQITLHAMDQQSIERLLNDPRILRAASSLALRVMRKRATIYGKFHCKQLAENALRDDMEV